jgi:hypothetical protein
MCIAIMAKWIRSKLIARESSLAETPWRFNVVRASSPAIACFKNSAATSTAGARRGWILLNLMTAVRHRI